jgi:hypothetical protein
MCLDSNLRTESERRIRDLAKRRGYIRVWKVCDITWDNQKRTGRHYRIPYKEGIRESKNYKTDEEAGWYAYLDKRSAKGYAYNHSLSYNIIKVCYAKPSWIKEFGKQLNSPAGIFTHLAFPDWDRGDMTIREFRALCRKNKP